MSAKQALIYVVAPALSGRLLLLAVTWHTQDRLMLIKMSVRPPVSRSYLIVVLANIIFVFKSLSFPGITLTIA